MFWILLSVCLFHQSSFSQEADIGRKEEHFFYVGYNGMEFYLTSRSTVEQTYYSKRSTEYNTFYIHENFFDRVKSIKGEYDDDDINERSISAINPENEDVFLSDYRIHKISFPDKIEVGKSGFYRYEREYKDIAYFPIMFVPNLNRVDSYAIIVEHPDGVQVDFDIYFTAKNIPYTLDTTDPERTILNFSAIERFDKLPYYPFDGFHAAIFTSVRYQGNINPVTPADFLRWYSNLLDSSIYSINYSDPALHSAITTASSNRDKVKMIYDYVRKNVRYIAEEQNFNAIVPRSPTTVFTRKYGDCKDKAFLISALAKKYGVTVYPVLVSTTPEPPFQETHPTQFNHVICLYEEGNERIYFDPTSMYSEFGDLPQGDMQAQGLILNKLKPEQVIVPHQFSDPTLEISIEGDIEQPKQAKARVILRNDYLSTALRAKAELTGIELENTLSNLVTHHFQKISFDYFTFESESDSQIVFTANADMKDFIIASTEKRYIPQMPFSMIDNSILKREADSQAIYLEEVTSLKLDVSLRTPALKIQSKTAEFGDPSVASFKGEARQGDNGNINLSYSLQNDRKTLTGNARAAFVSFAKDFLKSKKNMFTITQNQ